MHPDVRVPFDPDPWEGNTVAKAAIVIGVDNAGSMPALNAAASGARRFAAWLRKEGFRVKQFVDTKKPVTVSDLYQAIHELVDPPVLDQLVIYFSGHGFLNKGSEYWMLSGAPENANEAVLLEESARFARRCGIPHVVFVSDACRSAPDSFQITEMQGGVIFPNLGIFNEMELDRFYATLPGDPAVELPLADSIGQFDGIYTSCFLDAFRRPDEDMVRSITVDGAVIKMVPNRHLKPFLKRVVSQVAQAKSIRLDQKPDAIIESGESYYLGQVRTSKRGAGRRASLTPGVVASVADIARMELVRSIGATPSIAGLGPLDFSDPNNLFAYDDRLANLRTWEPSDPGRQLSADNPSVAITGARVESAIGVNVQVHVAYEILVELVPNFGVGSLILRFTDGSGTVLAIINGYNASIVVEDGRVVNVSYLPTFASGRWNADQEQWRLDELRVKVAAAARSGVFHVDRDSADSLAREIRYLKSVDPTLGLYAAYAYGDADLQDDVLSVQRAMENDLSANLFDVVMLAGRLSQARRELPVVPFCPMLSQGWGLLRALGVQLPQHISRAGAHLRPALWTTFEPVGMDMIENAYHTGELI